MPYIHTDNEMRERAGERGEKTARRRKESRSDAIEFTAYSDNAIQIHTQHKIHDMIKIASWSHLGHNYFAESNKKYE